MSCVSLRMVSAALLLAEVLLRALAMIQAEPSSCSQ